MVRQHTRTGPVNHRPNVGGSRRVAIFPDHWFRVWAMARRDVWPWNTRGDAYEMTAKESPIEDVRINETSSLQVLMTEAPPSGGVQTEAPLT